MKKITMHWLKFFIIFIVILEMVRRRKLQEEYSWLWIVTGAALILLVLRYDLLEKVTQLIGAVLPTSTLFFFGQIFLMLLCLQFSMRISKLNMTVKNLAQELAILKSDKRTDAEGEGKQEADV